MLNISVADTRRHLAEILGKVAYGGKDFLITKKGRPMARLIPATQAKLPDKRPATLGDIKGWIEDDDPFFRHLEIIRKESRRLKPKNVFQPKKSSR